MTLEDRSAWSEFDHATERIPDVPDTPGGYVTDKIAEAVEEMARHTGAADDALTDAYDVLQTTPEALADERYRAAVTAALAEGRDTGEIPYELDKLREQRARALALAAQHTQAAYSSRNTVRKAIREDAPACGAQAVAAYQEAEQAYLAAWSAFNAAESRVSRAADVIGQWAVLGAWETNVVNRGTVLKSNPLGDLIRNRRLIDSPPEAAKLARLRINAETDGSLDGTDGRAE